MSLNTGSVLIGTSGYSYDDWVGCFYPTDLPRTDYLGYYAREFPVVEINYTYYRQPNPETLRRMIDKTPQEFRFSVKAHRSLTHETSSNCEQDIAIFKQGIAPLVDSARICAVLFQYPYSFHYTPQSRRFLHKLLSEFEGFPRAVEFRHREWQRDSVTDGLRDMNVCQVSVDEPKLANLPEPSATATADFAYVRFHGRNGENWWTGDNVTRYDYLYNSEELNEWVPRFQDFLKHCKSVYLFFNNHSRAQAVTNARMMRQIIEDNPQNPTGGDLC